MSETIEGRELNVIQDPDDEKGLGAIYGLADSTSTALVALLRSNEITM